MPYFSTPPFWGGAEDYGADRETLPLPRPKFRAPGIGKDREAMVPVMDEDTPPPLSSPVEGPVPLSEPKTPSWTTSDEIRETLRQQPKLERAKGWKGVLQVIGDAVVNPELMHPKYYSQARDYNQRLDSLTALKKLEDTDAENERRRLVAEAQMSSDRATEAYRNKQIADMGKPAGLRPLMNTSQGIYDPNTDTWKTNPNAPAREGKETPAEATARREKDADRFGLKGAARTEFILTGKMPKVNGNKSGGGTAPPNAFRVIESEKARALAAAEKDARKAIETVRQNRTLWSKGADGKYAPDPAKMQPETDRIYGELAKQKQQIQNDYESKIASAGADPTHFEYPDMAPAPKPPAPATAQAAAPARAAQPVAPPTPAKSVRVMDPKTGEVRSFASLSAEEIADAKSKGYQVLD